MALTPTPDLFAPFRLGPFQLPHRVVMAPMTRSRAGEGNVPTEQMAEYYAQRASAGLIVTEASQVSLRGVGYPATPGIHSGAQMDGWRRVTRAVHHRGGRIFLQLWHVGRISHPSFQPGGALPVAPSALRPEGKAFTAGGLQDFVTPHALEEEEIAGVVGEFAAAAQLAREAGFDGVELHGANGYLIDQFLRDGSNRRTDRYGGSAANRARFVAEVAGAVVEVWGPGRVGVRFSPLNPYNDMADTDPEATFGAAAAALDPLGLAYLHVVEPSPEGVPAIIPQLREHFSGPVIVNGGHDRDTADRVIAGGYADLVSFGAPFLANPDLPERLRLGAPLNAPDPSTFYGGDHRGYTDYPTLEESEMPEPA